MEYVWKNTHLFGYSVAPCWPHRRSNCASAHDVLVSCGLSVSLESRVLCWRDACTVTFIRAQAFWAWQCSTFLSFIAGNNVLYYQYMTFFSHLFCYFFQCLQKHICICISFIPILIFLLQVSTCLVMWEEKWLTMRNSKRRKHKILNLAEWMCQSDTFTMHKRNNLIHFSDSKCVYWAQLMWSNGLY